MRRFPTGRTSWTHAVAPLVACTACLVAAWWACSRTGRADECIERYRFPSARQGSIIEHTFHFVNKGDEPVTIARIGTSCACTVADSPEGSVVAPGARVDIPVRMQLPSRSGQVQSLIHVELDGRPEPLLFAIEGYVVEEYPPEVLFGNVKRGEETARVFEVKTFPGQPCVAILGTCHDRQAFEVTHRGKEGDPSVQVVTVKITPAIAYGQFESLLTLTTNDLEVPTKRVVLKGYVWMPLETRPETVHLGVVHPEVAQSAVVEVFSPYGKPVTITELQNSNPDFVALDVRPLQAADRVHVVISAKQTPLPKGFVKSTIICRALVGQTQETARIEAYGYAQ